MALVTGKRKRTCDDEDDDLPKCILCNGICNAEDDRSSITAETWQKLKSYALQWQGLDRFGDVFKNGKRDLVAHFTINCAGHTWPTSGG